MDLGKSLPNNWTICTLDDVIVKISNGANVTQYEEKVGYPISRIETIWNQGIDLQRVKYVKENDPFFVEKYSLQHGDILLSHINSDAHLGKTGIFKKQVDVLIHGINILLIRPSKEVNHNFLNYQFNFIRTSGGFIDIAQRSVNQSSVNQAKLKKLNIYIPPINEQHRIVAKIEEIFSELDQGIDNLKTAQVQLKVYRQALLKHAFEGKLTAEWRAQNADKLESAEDLLARIAQARTQRYQDQLNAWQASKTNTGKPKAPKPLTPLTPEELAELPALPEGWGWGKLGLMTCGVEYGTSAKSSESGSCPVLRMGNIQNGKFDYSDLVFTDDEIEISKYLLKSGDVLFNRTNSPELVGKTAIFKSKLPAIFAGYLIRLNQLSSVTQSEFLNYFLNSHIAKQHGNKVKTDGVNQSNINGDKLVNYPFPFCSLIEQEQIITILDSKLSEIDQLEQTITTALQQAEALRQSILKKAFSGQLVPQDPNDEPAAVLLERIKKETIK